ncbi:DUF4244 domain-containing protein [Pseudokineococcus basanitobsidens]|uniref:DUF4244 domain-containing protein n=1 Tax=Pseudokineococcus basanitobsidens TaxID=1926649 RepID=A0ABU8RNS8_9ACTN
MEPDGVSPSGRGEGSASSSVVVAVPSVREVASVDGRRRDGGRLVGDAGMATAEYAIATLAACGFAGLLLALLASDQVRGLLLGIVQRALTVG